MGASTLSDVLRVAQIPFTLSAIGLDGILWPQQANLPNNTEVDYIVIGAGTAGSVVASNLVADRNTTVLALEAGGDPPIDALLAGLFSEFPGSAEDYNYTSTMNENATRETMLTAGKMLGGSASLNHFILTRGTSYDYDCWAKLSGNQTWNYENVLPYFKKSENVSDAEILSEYSEYHGTNGRMGVTRQLEDDKVDNLLKSFEEVGNPTVLDLNAKVFVGITQPQYMLANKVRQTPAYTHLKPVKDYSNLYVMKNSRVIKIVFDGNVAVAVKAIYEGKTYTFRAKKEIILCAGVYNTPQILMLSGIGPKEHLESFNIEVVRDLPVGEGLVDQVAVPVVHKLKKYLLSVPDPSTLLSDETKIPFPILVGAVPLNKSATCPDYETFNLLFAHDTTLVTVGCAQVFGIPDDICDLFQKQATSRDALFSLVTHLQPKSKGHVRLGSTDPLDDPVISPGYFNDPDDMEKMVEFVKDFISVGNSSYFQEINAELAGLDLSQCADKEPGSDDYWKCYVTYTYCSVYHQSSSCAMGRVVDADLKVKGVDNLRVVDASVMPKIPHGAPNAAVMMLAEKASDMIRGVS